MASFPFGFWRLDPNFGPSGLGFNYGYQFDGVDEYINFGNVLDLEKTDAFSFTFWFKQAATHLGAIVCKMPNTSPYNGYIVYVNSDKLIFYLGGTTSTSDAMSINGTTTLLDDTWYFGAVTYDGSNTRAGMKLYLNAVQEGSNGDNATLTGNMSNTTSLTMGSRNGSALFFNGRMDDIQFYDFELNATQVLDIYNSGYVTAPTLAPTHHWKLGESDTWDGSNWTVNDSIGSLNGTSVNMEESDRKLGVAYSMDFDGVNEYIDFGNIFNFEYTDSFTFSFYLKDNGSGNQDLFGRNQVLNFTGWYIYDGGGKINIQLRNNNSNRITVGWTRSSGVWHHVLITYNGNGLANGLNCYIDNTLVSPSVSTDTLSSNSIINTGTFRIGEFIGSLGNYAGNLMYLSIFDSELSASDVTSLYNSGVPVDPRDVGLSPSFFVPLGGENDSFDGSNWTIVDEINGNNGTSVNMEEADKTSETP